MPLALDALSPPPVQPAFIGRQPILDKTQAIIGYELLFRAHQDDHSAEFASAAGATAQVVCTAFTEFGIASAMRHLKAFINVDALLLDSDAIELLPVEQVVLEVTPTHDAALIARCRFLRERGYAFAVAADPRDPLAADGLLDLASYIKIDITDAEHETIMAAVLDLRGHARKLVATKVETAEQAEWCEQQGFQYFQGFYFAHPVIEAGRKLDPTAQGLLRLINLVSGDADTPAIEAAFKGDPALTMNLLRIVNSAALGLRTPVNSIAQAITLLGRRQLLRWLQLLMFRGSGGGIATNPLMLHAALRGRFMELLVERRYPGDRALLESAFIVGLMSMMPAALRLPMEQVLEQIALAPEVRDAVGNYEGPLGQLLLLIEYYDDNNVLGCELTLERIGEISQHMLNTCLAEVLGWIEGLDA